MGEFLDALGSGGISTGLGLLSGGLSRLFGGDPYKKAWKYQKQAMELQQQYNKENAALGQQYNKEMWDYTNYENQRKHMEEAGLNPALMYGMKGGGGVSSNGASVSGGGLLDPATGGAQMQQAETNKAQLGLIGAQTAKAFAEAKKIGGVDTELTAALTEVQNATKDNLEASTANLQAALDGIIADSEVSKRTKEQRIMQVTKALEEANNRIALQELDKIYNQKRNDIIQKYGETKAEAELKNLDAQTEKVKADREYIIEQTRWIAFEQITKRISANAAKTQASAAIWNAEINEEQLENETMKAVAAFLEGTAEYKNVVTYTGEVQTRDWIKDMIGVITDGIMAYGVVRGSKGMGKLAGRLDRMENTLTKTKKAVKKANKTATQAVDRTIWMKH